MQTIEHQAQTPQKHILSFIDERIASCESKRSRSLFLMNLFKLIRVVSGVLAVLFVALLAADGFEQGTKFTLNVAALICTSLTALGSELANAFGFEKRFNQNVRTAGQLRSLKSQFELELTLMEQSEGLDYREWHDTIIKILEGQSVRFDADFEQAHKQK